MSSSFLRGSRRGQGVLPGVQFDGIDCQPGRRLDLPGIGIEEQADGNAGRTQPVDRSGDPVAIGDDIQPALGGNFFPLLGHERRLIGLHVAGDFRDFGLAGHLQIQLDRDSLAEDPQIAVGNVPAILAQVQRDAVGAAELGQRRRPDGVRLVGPPRLPNCGHVIDIDAKFRHSGDYSRRNAAR